MRQTGMNTWTPTILNDASGMFLPSGSAIRRPSNLRTEKFNRTIVEWEPETGKDAPEDLRNRS